jgi:hypothetical protein
MIAASAADLELNFTLSTTSAELSDFVSDGATHSKFAFLNYDLRSFESNGTAILAGATINITLSNFTATSLLPGGGVPVLVVAATTDFQGLIDVTTCFPAALGACSGFPVGTGWITGGASPIQVLFKFTGATNGVQTLDDNVYPVAVDFFNFGQSGDGNLPGDRFNNAIYRLELEETGDNTGQFEGTVEYIMLNQLNVNDTATYAGGIDSITDQPEIIVHEDLTDEDAPRINYLDLGADGVATQVADQQEAPTHSGVVSFDSSTYKVADTVTITLDDNDLNTDVETIGIFTVVGAIPDAAHDQVGRPGYGHNTAEEPFGRLLDVTFDDAKWTDDPANDGLVAPIATECAPDGDSGLGSTGFTLVETGPDTGTFTGDFQVPGDYCCLFIHI